MHLMVKTLCREQFSVMTEIKKEVPDIYIYYNVIVIPFTWLLNTPVKLSQKQPNPWCTMSTIISNPRQIDRTLFLNFKYLHRQNLTSCSVPHRHVGCPCNSVFLGSWSSGLHWNCFFKQNFQKQKTYNLKKYSKISFFLCKSTTRINGFCAWRYLQIYSNSEHAEDW